MYVARFRLLHSFGSHVLALRWELRKLRLISLSINAALRKPLRVDCVKKKKKNALRVDCCPINGPSKKVQLRPTSSDEERSAYFHVKLGHIQSVGEMEIKKRGFLSRMTEKRERKRLFLENGSKVLEELVAACNGKPIPIRTFSYQELSRATNSFDPRLVVNNEMLYNWYKGSFDDRTIFIKEYKEGSAVPDMAFTDIAISAKASAHKNVIKLVGCCLETRIPTLVYESAENGTLSDRIFVSNFDGARLQRQPMAWQSRLKIARQIAHAIAYLHTAFSRPIIHRHIKSRNIFLDRHDVPKLCDFSLSVSVPEGETDVKVELREYTIGYVCPIYFATSRVTEKTDVYSFGRVLLDLLTGRSSWQLHKNDDDYTNLVDYLRNRAMNEIVDPAILAEEGGVNVQQQLQAVLQLAIISIDEDPVKRQTMVDVTKELRRIERFVP